MPTISYCCIFKNEEKHLPKWIECAKAVATEAGDEIIACDTGSTDKSCQLLRNAGIEPIFFKWTNDFSQAKNFVIDKAKGDWIIFMDCDEYFAEKSLPFVRKSIEDADSKNGMIIQSYMHNINEDDNNKLISTCYHWRIFKNHPDIRYTKAIHEYIKYFGEGQTVIIAGDLLILHTGYSSSLAKLKGERNLEFLEAEIANNETDELTTQQAFYMANTYAQIGDMLKAAEYADIAIDGPDEELGFMTVKMYRDIIQREEMKKGGADFTTIINILDEALLRVPDQPDFLIDKIRYYAPRDLFYETENLCFRTLQAIQNPSIMNRCESNASTMLFYVYNVLSNMMFHKGEVTEARRYAMLSLQERPDDPGLIDNFVKVFRYEILSIVKPIIDRIYPNPNKEEKDKIKRHFKIMNYGDVYLHYVKPKNNTFEYFICKGLYSKAVKLCEKELMELFKYAAFAYANFPKETQILKAVAPMKYLSGTKKQPQGEMNLQTLVDKFINVFCKIILACFSMTDEEFEKNKNILNYLASPTKDFLLAGFGQATQGIQLTDTKKFYERIYPICGKECLQRLGRVVQIMPSDDEFLYKVIQDMISLKEIQSAYNLIEKLSKKDLNYYLLRGVVFLYAKDMKMARENFIKSRALGAQGQEIRDFIKMTDPSKTISINL